MMQQSDHHDMSRLWCHPDHGGPRSWWSLIGALLVAPILYAPHEDLMGPDLDHSGTMLMRDYNRYPIWWYLDQVHNGTWWTPPWDHVDEGLQ